MVKRETNYYQSLYTSRVTTNLVLFGIMLKANANTFKTISFSPKVK